MRKFSKTWLFKQKLSGQHGAEQYNVFGLSKGAHNGRDFHPNELKDSQ